MTITAQVQADIALIKRLGGPSKLAAKLGYSRPQRVHNWLKRGIPPSVKLAHPHIFLWHVATQSAVEGVHA
ncbi:hypothetical protein [Pseudorhodoferax soli]|uniref:YdaS antitoxin of YdaST toxin-antitoxin system n=1 Tax=Pseudorhodoferax soli TaxID=545864 RepID=A0A368Y174_9BURK|nr:hypothetical protein [Pseudorhodoferax soli]RCW73835.1 hypothetical protein DES41_102149 [Pseudorhodoferax soli]